MPGVSVFLQLDVPPRDAMEVGRLADQSEFKQLWLNDSQDAFMDCWAYAGMFAINTSRVRIGPGVTNPLTRHPRVTATAAVTVHEISGGRANLGLGAGDNATDTLGWKPAPFKAVRECVEICREKFKAKGADIPIYLTGGSPRILAYASKEADGIWVGGVRTPQMLRNNVERVLSKAKEVGRTKPKIELLGQTQFAISHDRREAMDDMRGSVAGATRRIKEKPETWPRELEHLRPQAEKVAQADDVFNHMRSRTSTGEFTPQAKLVTDEMVEYFAIFGTPQDVLPKFKALWDEAARLETRDVEFTFNLTPHGSMQGGKKRSFELFVREVLPKLRSG